MKIIKNLTLILLSIFVLNACSKDDDTPSCPTIEKVTMKINGEYKIFTVDGWGIDLNQNDSGHTLFISFSSGTFSPQQNSYSFTMKLPYKKTGNNIIKSFDYLRVENATSYTVDFAQQELTSKVTVNRNTCFSATFSGKATVNGTEITITEGVIDNVYDDPFVQ